tara:strand:- start:13732 stop:14451 length:720 start_codon:yes stop_codon:yes gene_type:complete
MAGITCDKERVSLDIARLRKEGKDFEICVEPDKALSFKSGENVDIKDVLITEKIFSDAKKGLEASEKDIKAVFGISDIFEIAEIIVKKGDIPLTTEYKNKLREQKRKQIIQIIHKNGVDPKTHIPHPINRIENAIEAAKVHIDERKSVQTQVQDILKKIRVILPIRFEVKELAVKIPASYAPKSYPIMKSFGKLLKEEWQNDGSLVAVVEMPGGLEEDFHQKLNALCHGEVESKVLNTK